LRFCTSFRASRMAGVFSMPPGLEAVGNFNDLVDEASSRSSSEAKPIDLKAVEERLISLGPNPSTDAILEAVQEAVHEEVQRKVQEKTEELLARGKQVVGKMQVKHKEKTQELLEEVANCQKRHQVLAVENERLRQVLNGLATRFSILSAGGYPKDFSLSPDQSTTAGMSPLQMEETPSGKPYTSEPPGLGSEATLPDVPAFPFPADASTPATSPGTPAPTLSLAEALGQQTPQRTPLSLMSSLTPSVPSEAPPSSPFPMGMGASSGGMFNFTLRKADGAELGLNVSHHEDDQVLRVEGVRPDGAVEAWNRQCASTGSNKAVLLGDRIISVNSVSFDAEKMLEECRDRQLLKLTVVRAMFPLPKAATKPRASSEFRADAPVFVPGGSEAAPKP